MSIWSPRADLADADALTLRNTNAVAVLSLFHPDPIAVATLGAQVAVDPDELEQRTHSPRGLAIQLEIAKNRVGWDETIGEAREYWIAFEQANKDNLVVVVELAQELAKRNLTITDFEHIVKVSDAETLGALWEYVDSTPTEKQQLLRAQCRLSEANGETQEWWETFERSCNREQVVTAMETLSANNVSITLFHLLGADDPSKLWEYLSWEPWDQLTFIRSACGWDGISDDARQWWIEFEQLNDNQLVIVITVLQELLIRDATIDDFHRVFLNSETESLEEGLRLLDEHRLEGSWLLDEHRLEEAEEASEPD